MKELGLPLEVKTRKTGIAFRLIPAGTSRMGSEELGSGSDERPVHTVRISQPFWMGKYEVTNAEYRKFLKESGYDGARDADSSHLNHSKGDSKMPAGDRHPVPRQPLSHRLPVAQPELGDRPG